MTSLELNLLLQINKGLSECPPGMDIEDFSAICRGLESKGYIKCQSEGELRVIAVMITASGKLKLLELKEFNQKFFATQKDLQEQKEVINKEIKRNRKIDRLINILIGLVPILLYILDKLFNFIK